ncbi:TetR/AcrR family transcriptional regulator [Streptomyces sp. ID05-47C]|uniref:TetR/AcrR family transcriptional regulator n=1 Tax=Streptomyces sp. ID05-47C TaxID=3028665 RepID=UPI0029BC9BA1|nr:TetR family transcriptional regulator [Streptomyces sp. ID05-47C]MDX3574131.1 TetR family transcriptional regulator [Streptomyces sp. ID05-47C]
MTSRSSGTAQPSRLGSGPGRPTLSERHREVIKRDIALAALSLFAEKGLDGTAVGEVADALGVSTRTLWRYFPTKEAFVRPLLSAGMDAALRAVRDWPVDRPLLEAMEQVSSLGADSPEALGYLRTLVRMTRTEPGLRAVWLDVYYETATALMEIIQERTGLPPGSLQARTQAFALNAALLSAVEAWACDDTAEYTSGPSAVIREALSIVGDGLPMQHNDAEQNRQ